MKLADTVAADSALSARAARCTWEQASSFFFVLTPLRLPIPHLCPLPPLHPMPLSLQEYDPVSGRPAVMERLTQLGDAAAGAVGAVGSAIAIGQGAHSQVVLAATQGLLTLAGRVPLVGHLAAALQDLCDVYQVRPGAGNRGEASRADYLSTNSWPVGR